MSDATFRLEVYGQCPLCRKATRFVSDHPWLRDHLICQTCPGGSLPRERALGLVLDRMRPGWRALAIHESSPAPRALSDLMMREAPGYVGSHYFPDHPFGSTVSGYRNEDLEAQTFADGTFDVVITQDVLEHLFDPARALREIYRTLKPDGVFLATFPIHASQVDAAIVRATRGVGGDVEHLRPPEYHGNPIDGKGALVTYDYGYGIHERMAEWSGFEVEILRFCRPRQGILGAYTEVIVCTKPEAG